jgi:hypothetical protein
MKEHSKKTCRYICNYIIFIMSLRTYIWCFRAAIRGIWWWLGSSSSYLCLKLLRYRSICMIRSIISIRIDTCSMVACIWNACLLYTWAINRWIDCHFYPIPVGFQYLFIHVASLLLILVVVLLRSTFIIIYYCIN